ncbi:EAP30/Vps36 family protein [Theileria parva strain Muguga]|uniref:EAP30/Vps36 family protein n=1 Tax=Theileria parva strain Muguga TaxID=333668 RepID=UPI001C61D2D2|nr:EAP30/Vps36 family protein [Theileria parva strain Muguga]EAN34200.2 EAP30/Vps36 family protein [Theileria parva strain Muguga]
MTRKLVEETVLKLENLKVGIGVLKRFYACTNGVLTTFRLSFNYTNNKPKTIFVSSITTVKISNSFFKEYIMLQCGSIRYFMSCSDNSKLYSELLRVVKLNETSTVLNSPRTVEKSVESPDSRSLSVPGISRVLKIQQEKIEESEDLCSATTELHALKNKCKLVKDVLVKVTKYDQEGFNSTIDKVFKTLGVDIFSQSNDNEDGSDTPTNTEEVLNQLRKVLSLLLSKNESILLHEFYVAANRLMLADLLSPSQLVKYVNKLENDGLCKLNKVGNVYLLSKSHESISEEEFCNDLVRILNCGPTDLMKYSKEANISTSLAQVKLNIAEKMGLIVRDETIQMTNYYKNLFNKMY